MVGYVRPNDQSHLPLRVSTDIPVDARSREKSNRVPMQYHWLTWGNGANAIGRYYPEDKETCTNCGKRIPKSQPPAYFELDRVLCNRCHQRRPDISHVSKCVDTVDP